MLKKNNMGLQPPFEIVWGTWNKIYKILINIQIKNY